MTPWTKCTRFDFPLPFDLICYMLLPSVKNEIRKQDKSEARAMKSKQKKEVGHNRCTLRNLTDCLVGFGWRA